MARHESSQLDVKAGPEPLGKARRWDKSKKEYTNTDQPNIIKECNAYMGGVDMLDAHLARCKFPIRTRRWYMVLFWHFLSVAVINAWLLYQHDCEAQGITGSKVLKLRKFQGLVAQGLVEVGKARRRVCMLPILPPLQICSCGPNPDLKIIPGKQTVLVTVNGHDVCGPATFTAVREISQKSRAKVDEEGLEIAVCRHGILLQGLNHYRGEKYAYPMFLQKELEQAANVTLFCMDIACS
ncbi:Chimeric ERCC6-PGBD3 protein [Anabarilius grahami]|uniref:Chimeric ERCC6-PGBD3 protein n=1 Tax=Anabarilius grahami TaxID=495550 RepID=A0A3N0Z174_ANAGA|nr:Chimeric ERCC6-PGBD3 protein [Anabarilius grahami]